MQVNETANKGLKRAYKVIVGADEIDNKVQAKLKELGARVHVPGFRSGKAPMAILRQRYAGHVLGEVLEKTVHEVTEGLLTERSLRPAAQPKLDIVSYDEGKDLEFSVELEVMPDVGDLDFSVLKITRPVAEVDDKAVDEALARIAAGQNNTEVVSTARKSKAGDVAVIDFHGKIDGVDLPGGKGEDHHLELGSGSFIPGFEDQVIGAKAGDSLTVNVSFPDDYHATHLAGKAAEFAVTVKELRQSVPVKIDDELAKMAGKDSLEDLKQMIRDQLAKEYAEVSRNKAKQALLDSMANSYEITIPEVMAEEEFKAIWGQVEHAKEHGHPDPDDAGKSDEQLRSEYRTLSNRRVKLGLLLTETGGRTQIEVTQQDINQAIMKEMTRFPGQEQAVINYYTKNKQALDSLRAPLYEDKVVDFILERAKVTDKKVSVEDLYAEDAPAQKSASEDKPAKKAPAKKKAAAKAEA